ncbi:MAG: hypothetical protein AB7S26_30730 [Sandaracinaceae bacterium]
MSKEKIREFIVRLPVKNERGEKVGEKEFVTYAGLLALAHSIGLDHIHATIIQMPTEANGMTAVVRAVVQGKRGTYSGLGDASPANVNRRVANHLLRLAETRAKARALRDYTNIGMVALEELGGDDDVEALGTTPVSRPSAPRRQQEPAKITDGQKRMLWRQAAQLGHEGDAALAFLAQRLEGQPDRATRKAASSLIDALAAELRAKPTNGASHA